MVELAISGAAPVEHGLAPAVALRVTARAAGEIAALLLRCVVRIEARRELHWTQATLSVGRFVERAEAELELPCGYDFAVGANRFLREHEGETVPLCVVVSGTVFAGEPLRALPLTGARLAYFALPVATVRAALERHYRDQAVLSLRRDVFARLERWKERRGLATWDQAMERLLMEGT